MVNSGNNYSGRVEIYHPEFGWATLCHDDGYSLPGNIACQQLGFIGANKTYEVFYGAGTGPILLDELYCTGAESYICDCEHDGWDDHDCVYDEDASVECY